MLAPILAVALEVHGNAAFTTGELAAALHDDLPYGDNAEHRDRASLVLAAYYWDHGYATVKVGDFVYDPARNTITTTVREGPKFTMGAIAVTGYGRVGDPEVLVTMRPGETFSRTKIADDREAIATYYEDLGYAYVNVLPLSKVDLAHRTIAITYEIELGNIARYGTITIVGNTRTPELFIATKLLVASGDAYSRTLLEASKRRIATMGFANVVVSTRHGAKPDLVDVVFEVTER